MNRRAKSPKIKIQNPFHRSSIGSMKSFGPNNLDISFHKWAESKCEYIHQLFASGQLKTSERLQTESKLPNTDHFRFSQLTSCLVSHKEWSTIRTPTPLEKALIDVQVGRAEGK
ncbi:hypothetical protein GOODEAATRI_031819 [Goodea atripinnis]|uniref:Uncharacterized protein n=1 Tax=Goodea atripinnis TaxID=208336 RepID=A0ABV0NPS5_9TELE